MSIKELVKQSNTILLDVRTPQEFNQVHVEGAMNIPLQELQERVNEIPKNNNPIVCYCLSGGRSGQATYFLKNLGYEVYNGGGVFEMLELKNN